MPVATFDQHLENQQGGMKGGTVPFWSLDFDNEEKLLEWLNAEITYLKEQAQGRVVEQRKNLAAYRGISLRSLDTRNRDEQALDNQAARRSKNPRVIYNHMVDLVEQHVARLTKYRGAVAANPSSEDNQDRIVAGIADDLVEKFWEKVGIDKILQKLHRRKRILSEDFIGVFWNTNLGPYDRDYLIQVFKEKGIKGDPSKMTRGEISRALKDVEFPKIDTGAKGPDGKALVIDRPMRRGDVQYRHIMSWDMLLQRKDDYDLVEMCSWREWVDLETLKAMHPKAADKITVDSQRTIFDLDTCEDVSAGNKVEVWHTYHKSTDLLDQGRYVKWCKSAVLVNKPNPYRGWDDRAILPVVRIVDIDTPAVLNGDATVTHGRGPLAVYNNLVSLKIRNRFHFSHPKWFYPRGSIKIESLTNDKTLVAYKGMVKPELAQPALNEANETEQMQETKNDLQQIMGVYGVSRGEPPKGVTAAVALTFLDETENERENSGIQNHTDFLRELALQTLWIMADHYGEDEGRLEDLLGKNRAYQAKDFKLANLRDIADLRIQNMTALPQQKSARMQYILDFKKNFPSAIPDDVAIDVLGLGEVERMRNIVTVAIRKAEDENEAMINGTEPEAPIEGEDLISHYRVHRRQMNEPMFTRLPKKSRQYFDDHVMATEMMMWNIGMRNPLYAQATLQQFPDFPIIFVPDPPPAPPAPMPGMDMAQGGMPPAGLPSMPMMPQEGGDIPPPDSLGPLAPGAESVTPPQPTEAPGAEAITPLGV